MPWFEVSKGRYERAIGENETFIKILADAALPLDREHWAIDTVVTVTPLGTLAQEDLSSLCREAWKALRFDHPTIAAYIVDDQTLVYEVPDHAALEKWASETFQVVEDKTADEIIPHMRPGSFAAMIYLPQASQLLFHSQHWRIDGIGAFIIMDEFCALAARSSPLDISTISWGQETVRLTPPVEEAAHVPTDPSAADKLRGQQCLQTFGAAAGAIGIASYTSSEVLPAGTRSARLSLNQKDTSVVIAACKARRVSVTAAVHASIAAANYVLAAPENRSKHYTSTIRYSFRPFLPDPCSGREYASTLYTTGWMKAVPAESSWEERAKAYHEEYHKGLSSDYISAHREYALGLCNLLRNMPQGGEPPTDVDISSMGVAEKFIAREQGTAERGLRVDGVSIGLEMANRQCVCHLWTFRDQLCLNLVYNESFYNKADMETFLVTVRDSLLQELSALSSQF